MASFIIEGGHRLKGDITPQGAKNEALQVLCAVLLTSEPVRIKNIPDIVDVNNQIQMLRDMGVEVTKHSPHDYTFCAARLDDQYLCSEAYTQRSQQLRGSVMMLGPLLARRGKAIVAKPGGDQIGRRRLDTHFQGMLTLGAHFTYDEAKHLYNVEAKQLKGAYMLLDEASVTGTANIIMAAVLAQGTTTIYNAACEPYVQQLCRMLCRMGACISGIGSNLLTIEGVSALHGTEHTILPDMIEVGSFIGMAAMVGDGVRIRQVAQEKHEKKITFSESGEHEINVLTGAVSEILDMTFSAFQEEDLDRAYKVEPLEERIDVLCDELKLRHIERLQKGICSLQIGFVFNDLLTNFERVADHCSNIAVAMIELNKDEFKTHEYIINLKELRAHNFDKLYAQYAEKYKV